MSYRKLSLATVALALMLTTVSALHAPITVSAQGTSLYDSCEKDKLTQPLSAQASTATETATESAAATEAATPASVATEAAATNAGGDDIVFLSIVGNESQACYLASETFLQGNQMGLPAGFNGAVGITQTISGDVALDRTNVANSQIGDITINISEFKSDNPRRDSFIRGNYLQSNTYPYATFKNVTLSGLPTGSYQEGATLEFQITGTLNVHNMDRQTTFDATGTFKNGTLVVKATTDLKISDFGIETPAIGGMLKVDDPIRLELNIVARASAAATATPAA